MEISVKPGCVGKLEAALHATETFRYRDDYPATLDVVVPCFWYDDITVDFGDKSSLEQLAEAADDEDHRKARISGCSHQRWRSWVEEFAAVCAPFAADGSFIEVRGEEHELVRYLMEGGEVIEKRAMEVWTDEYEQLLLARGHVDFAVDVIGDYDDGSYDAEETLDAIRSSLMVRGLMQAKQEDQ